MKIYGEESWLHHLYKNDPEKPNYCKLFSQSTLEKYILWLFQFFEFL